MGRKSQDTINNNYSTLQLTLKFMLHELYKKYVNANKKLINKLNAMIKY
jgi:hypothetical protein